MDQHECEILTAINAVLQDPDVARHLDEIADRVEANFTRSTGPLAWETVPLGVYKNRLPSMIRSSWIFLLREGSASGAERHPNSHQRVRSWRGSGDFQIWSNDAWESHFLANAFDAAVEQQWATIHPNVWHQAVVPAGKHWIVVSFHTATAEDLIEERPDAENESRFQRRVYARMQS